MRFSKNSIKTFILMCVLILFFLFGIAISFNSMSLSERILNKPLTILVIYLLLYTIYGKNHAKLHLMYPFIFILMSIASVFSALVNMNQLLLELVICGLLLFVVNAKLNVSNIINQYSIIFIPYVIACLIYIIVFGISSFNSQGVIYAFLGIILLNLLCIKKTHNFCIYIFVVTVIVFLLALTRSRTSMLAFVIASAITYYYLFLKKCSIKNIIVCILLIVVLLVAHDFLITFFTEIFFNKWGNSDLTSNRMNIWITIFNRVKIFGHGLIYAEGFDAHNTFMEMLDTFGVFPFIMMIVGVLNVFYNIKQSKNKIVFINFFTAWVIISMFENLDIFTSRLLPVTFMFLIHIVLLTNDIQNMKISKLFQHRYVTVQKS